MRRFKRLDKYLYTTAGRPGVILPAALRAAATGSVAMTLASRAGQENAVDELGELARALYVKTGRW